MFKTERILTFIDLVEERSFTAVARKRGVTKAAVSKQINLLEKECGVQLFNRTSNPIAPTEHGMEVYEKTRGLKNSLKEFETVLNQFKSTPQGILRVSSSINFANYFIIPHLKTWLDQHPLVTLELQMEERHPDIEKENLDIVMGNITPGPSTSIQVTLGDVRYLLAASPKYLQQHGHPKSLEDLRSHRYLTHIVRKKNYQIRALEEEVVIEPYLYLNSFQGLVNLAVEGVGIIWVSEWAAKDHIANGSLVELLPEKFKDCHRRFYLYYKETKHVLPKVRAFIDFVKQCCQKS